MLVFTHLALGKFLHEKFHKNPVAKFKLKRLSFLAGNVHPDMSSMASLGHYRDETYHIYRDAILQAMDDQCSDEDRSFSLGVACHFLCDYFIKYHAKEPYKSAGIIEHLWYELQMHFQVLYFMRVHLSPFDGGVEEGSKLHLTNLLEAYNLEDSAMATDCSYTFFALDMLLNQVMGYGPFGLIGLPGLGQHQPQLMGPGVAA